MTPVIEIKNLNKVYENGFKALDNVHLSIERGEIFSLLGPNGAGKTTLISIICGITKISQGELLVDGKDIVKEYRQVRSLIGLVPQELTTEAFETVWQTVRFSRGLFGKKPNDSYLEDLLKDLALWNKKDNKLLTLSGGMKRRVMIAKALAHEPAILFLDEPTAGVDVELRTGMWRLVHRLRENGVTIILTTHYIDEAEEMADRIGIINKGRIVLVDEKRELMRKLGKKELILDLKGCLNEIPTSLLNKYALKLSEQGEKLVYSYDSLQADNKIAELLEELNAHGIIFADLNTQQSSLEDIFVRLVNDNEFESY